MSLQGGGLCFLLLSYFLSVSTNDIQENISSEVVKVDERGTLTLLCNATEVPGANVVWRREDSRNITLRSGEVYKFTETESSTVEGDPLILTLIERINAGAFICTANNGVNTTVRKRFTVVVNYRPLNRIPSTHMHVHASLGEDATFRCHVEAQPRGTNTWILHPGKYIGQNPDIPLVNSSKYVIEETHLNEVTTLMQLTVRNVEPADYLMYSCRSNNRLGSFNAYRRLRNQTVEHLL